VASESNERTRHLAFFTELASMDEREPSWRAVSAGLVVLRLLDAWIHEGAAAVAADGWGVRSVRAAVEEMPAGMPAQVILGGVVDALTSSRGGDLHAVAPRLMAYARGLDLDAQWGLAADVYETVIAHVDPVEDADVLVNAMLRRAHCLRQLGEHEVALEAFQSAADVARSSGDVSGSLRARIGEAKLVMSRGNLPAADRLLEQTVATATAHGLLEVRSLATHDRSQIAHLRSQFDVAVKLAHDALRDSTNECERDRILSDLAGSFYMMGVKSSANDAFLVLASTAREQSARWVATINLMELASEAGTSLQFERYRQQLASAKLPPLLRAQFELHAGRGYQTLGEMDAGRTWLERAVATATAHSLNQIVFEAEQALTRRAPSGTPSRESVVEEVPEFLSDIVVELREMRELAGSPGR
jgi:Tfp pilus assembly protein PilF